MGNWRIDLHKNNKNRIVASNIWKNTPTYWQFIFLTNKCTRRCTYCYSENNNKEMSYKTFKQLCNVIHESYDRHQYLYQSVNFVGGEPLLETNKIGILSDIIFEKTPGMEITLHTNGDLLNKTDWNHLEKVSFFHLNVTNEPLDEIKRRLNIIEKNRNKDNSFKSIISIVLDDFNINRIEDLTHYAIQNAFRFKIHRDLFRGYDESYKKIILNKMHKMCDIIENYVSKGYKISTLLLLNHNFFSCFSNWTSTTCGYRTESIFVDGSVGICQRAQFIDNNIVGNIWDNDLKARLDGKRTFWSMEHDKENYGKECLSCDIKYDCSGGCILDRIITNKKPIGSYPFCQLHKEIFPRLKDLHHTKIKTIPYKDNYCIPHW